MMMMVVMTMLVIMVDVMMLVVMMVAVVMLVMVAMVVGDDACTADDGSGAGAGTCQNNKGSGILRRRICRQGLDVLSLCACLSLLLARSVILKGFGFG